MVERLPGQMTLLEKLKSEARGRDVLTVAVERLFSDEERRQFFEEYLEFLMPSNYRGPIEIIRRQAVTRVLQAVPERSYHVYEGWSKILNPDLDGKQNTRG